MATNIPPHNLREVIGALNLLMDNPDVTTNELMEVLPGPDFPTGGLVMGKSGIRRAYETGKGTITVRAKVEITQMPNGKERILVTELPYMVNKAKLIERISELHRDTNASKGLLICAMNPTAKACELSSMYAAM